MTTATQIADEKEPANLGQILAIRKVAERNEMTMEELVDEALYESTNGETGAPNDIELITFDDAMKVIRYLNGSSHLV